MFSFLIVLLIDEADQVYASASDDPRCSVQASEDNGSDEAIGHVQSKLLNLLHKPLQILVGAPTAPRRDRGFGGELLGARPRAAPLLPDRIGQHGRELAGVGRDADPARARAQRHARILHEQPRVHELVGRHGPRQHGHPGGHRLQHRVPPAVRHEPPHRRVPQRRHLRRPPAHHHPALRRRRRPRLEPFRDNAVAAHDPHERDGAPFQRLCQCGCHGRRQHRLATEAHVQDRTFREGVQPRAEIAGCNGRFPAAIAGGVRVRRHRAHRPHALEPHVLQRRVQVPPLECPERVRHESPALQIPETVLLQRLANLLFYEAFNVDLVQHGDLSPLKRRLAGDRRERNLKPIVAPHGSLDQAAEERVRHGGAEHAGGREYDPRDTDLGGERLRPPAEEVGYDGDDGVRRLRPGPREDGLVERGERVDEHGDVDGRAIPGVLEAGGEGRVGGEGEDEPVDGVGVRGEERGELGRVGGRGDDGEAESSRREEGGEVVERKRVALRREGDKEDVRRGGRRRHCCG
uniref:Uncharacterized protein n=1 Tax=Oryza punctata TaxID=4537 RepID=A0A0E0KW11_ORYPU